MTSNSGAMPIMRRFQLIGHRGARGEAPENTISGSLHARNLGLGAVEIDVRLTRDDQLVVIHDATVDRTTNATGPVAEFTAHELAMMDARGECPKWPEIIGISTLGEALEVLDTFAMVQIEIKKGAPQRLESIARAVIEAIRVRGIQDQIVISSFDPWALQIVARVAPDQRRAYIGSWDTTEFLHTARQLGCSQADVSINTSSARIVKQAHADGLRVVGFQCNTPEALIRAFDWELDGATSDYPSSILPLLQED